MNHPWGKTGRVTLDEGYVLIDRERVGFTFSSYHLPGQTRCGLMRRAGHAYLASRDAAVMWVLRRVDPRLWREERGSVWLVRKRRGEEYIEDGWYTGRRHPAIHDWLIIDPAGVCRDAIRTSTLARITARHYAEMTPR